MPEIQGPDRSRLEIKLGNYLVGPATALPDNSLLTVTQDYRRRAGSRMIPLPSTDIETRIPNGHHFVSRKLDGEFTVLVFDGQESFTINPGGTVRVGLPFMEEATELLKAAGVQSALIAGELHVQLEPGKRSRVHDVSRIARAPQSDSDIHSLAFAPFDLVALNSEEPAESYSQNFETITNLFADARLCQPVETEQISRAQEIRGLYQAWVEKEDAEGIVVRSDETGTFKVKPQHQLDVVVVGFTESTDDRQGLLHDVLVAVRRQDGSYHVLGRVGGGFSEDLRRSMLSDLKDMVVSSEYIEVNSDYVAYQMVRPEWVGEISCLDLISVNTRGGSVNRMVIDHDPQQGYTPVRRMPLATMISPQWVRLRDDKTSEPAMVSIEQLTAQVEVEMADADARTFQLPASEILHREVFTKVQKGSTMVRKFVLIKTNKESSGENFPAYALHYTDFSPNRKTPLARDLLVSDSEDQIQQMLEGLKEKNIKKGWEAV